MLLEFALKLSNAAVDHAALFVALQLSNLRHRLETFNAAAAETYNILSEPKPIILRFDQIRE